MEGGDGRAVDIGSWGRHWASCRRRGGGKEGKEKKRKSELLEGEQLRRHRVLLDREKQPWENQDGASVTGGRPAAIVPLPSVSLAASISNCSEKISQ